MSVAVFEPRSINSFSLFPELPGKLHQQARHLALEHTRPHRQRQQPATGSRSVRGRGARQGRRRPSAPEDPAPERRGVPGVANFPQGAELPPAAGTGEADQPERDDSG